MLCNYGIALPVVLLMLVANPVTAQQDPDPLAQSALALCKKIQQCARAEFALAQPQLAASPYLPSALDGLCYGVYEAADQLNDYPDLVALAQQCNGDLMHLSCDNLADDHSAGSCKLLNQRARQLGLVLE